MKKLFFICSILLGGVAVPAFPAHASQLGKELNTEKELPDDARSITVYKVVQVGGSAWSTSPVSAHYSASENCIYVNEGKRKNQPYSVSKNRAYGQSNDGRGDYQYTAGGYYFDL